MTALLLLGVTLPNMGNALRAATTEGVAGIFTAEQLSCVRHSGHETCSWSGTFRSAEGALTRTPVAFSGGSRGSLTDGQEIKAVDFGSPGRVYDPSNSYEWIFTVALLLSGYALLVLVAKRELMPPPAPRRASPQSSSGDPLGLTASRGIAHTLRNH
ncbi:hypothetical protein ACFYO0_09070 [Streptomyces sp. NPDC006365]|uniref:hypothetical protein n=1 Tax=Streptomyces sp. NPDC006365 TaxID=3364744 RepID=UPI0036B8B18E